MQKITSTFTGNRYDIMSVASRLGLHVERNKCLCPFHSDKHPSMTFRANYFRCWSCGVHGDSITLVRRLLGLSYGESLQWLDGNSIVGAHPVVLEARASEVQKADRVVDFSTYRYLFDNPILTDVAKRFLFDQRRLDEKVISDLRVSSNHSHLVIPYFAEDGDSLLGIQWRYLGNDSRVPRFNFARGSKPVVYNLPVFGGLESSEKLYIAEGTSDCWALLSSGKKAVAVPSATTLAAASSHFQRVRKHQNLHIFPDRDMPGENLFIQLKSLAPHIVRHQLPPGCKDFAEAFVRFG
jgi:hypothetical protein